MSMFDSPGGFITSGASGSLHDGVDLDAHMTGVNPAQRRVSGSSPLHAWVIIVGLLVILWLFGGSFRKILS